MNIEALNSWHLNSFQLFMSEIAFFFNMYSSKSHTNTRNRNELVSNNKAHKNYNMKIILFIIIWMWMKKPTMSEEKFVCGFWNEQRVQQFGRDYGYVWGWYRWNSVGEQSEDEKKKNKQEPTHSRVRLPKKYDNVRMRAKKKTTQWRREEETETDLEAHFWLPENYLIA